MFLVPTLPFLDLRSNDTSPDALFSVTPFPEFKFRPGRETSNSWPRFIFKSKSESLHAINNYKSAADGLSTWSNRHRWHSIREGASQWTQWIEAAEESSSRKQIKNKGPCVVLWDRPPHFIAKDITGGEAAAARSQFRQLLDGPTGMFNGQAVLFIGTTNQFAKLEPDMVSGAQVLQFQLPIEAAASADIERHATHLSKDQQWACKKENHLLLLLIGIYLPWAKTKLLSTPDQLLVPPGREWSNSLSGASLAGGLALLVATKSRNHHHIRWWAQWWCPRLTAWGKIHEHRVGSNAWKGIRFWI